MELRVLRSRRIHSDGRHNAFTGITRFAGRTLVCFRSGTTHASGEGVIRVIGCEDGESWGSVDVKTLEGTDLRDPKLVTWGDRALMYCGGRNDRGVQGSLVSVCADGASFSEVQPIAGIPAGQWLWWVRAHGERLYGTAYCMADGEYQVALYQSQDGLSWGHLVDFPVHGNETAIDFDEDGRLWALVREDLHGCVPALCTAEPPYTSFDWVMYLPLRLQGPMLKRLPGACVIVGRRWDQPGRRNLRTEVFVLEDDRDLQHVRALPSGGDTSYAGWLDDGPGRALVSYYSAHEHQMDVDWANEEELHTAEHNTAADIFLATVAYR